MKKLIISVGFIFLSVITFSQADWLKNLKIRQSFNDDESSQSPALLSLTFPKDQESSYLADIALGYVLPSNDPTGTKTGNIIAEYHRTNLSDAETNNFQVGYKHQWIFKTPPTALPVLNKIADYNTFRLNSTLKYRTDHIERSQGAAATFLFAYFQQGSDYKTWWSSPKFSVSQRFNYIITPEFGIEMQENFKADSTIYKGFVGRGVAGLSIGFGGSKPDPDAPRSPVGIGIWLFNIDATARYDVVGKSSTNSKFHPLIKTSLDFFILYKPVKLSIGGEFIYGDNPIEGFREFEFDPQQFWVVALKIQK